MWPVDPGLGRGSGHLGWFSEPVGVAGVRGVEGALPLDEDAVVAAVVQVGGVQQGEAGVVMGVVVPGDEVAAPGAGAREALEP